MPNRNVEGNYRYGYQGEYAEKEPELGNGQNSFELRLWDSKIGRWLTTDPAREFSSPYLGIGNNPVNYVDRRGDTISFSNNFVLSKTHTEAYLRFIKSKFGRSFTNDFGIGGKYEHINIHFSVHSDKESLDGHKKDYADGRTYGRLTFGNNLYERGFKKGENFGYLGRNIALNKNRYGFNVSFDLSIGYNGFNGRAIMDTIDTIAHEVQHVEFFMNDLLYMNNLTSTAIQHYIMFNTTSQQYKQRLDIWMENKSLWGDIVPDGMKDVEFAKEQM